ncbi:MAG: TadE/TadG family type IV pilus assembly protein [Oceanicaulis sp.]
MARLPLLPHFIRDRKGVSALEFALVAPVMVLMYLGSAELTQALTVDRKVTGAANAVADLVAQDDFVTDDELDDIRAAAAAILAPQPAERLTLRITSVRMDADGEIFVDWSESETLPPLTDDTLPPLPAGLLSPMGSIVMAEARYPYESPFQKTIDGTITLSDTAYLRPRRSPWVRRPS